MRKCPEAGHHFCDHKKLKKEKAVQADEPAAGFAFPYKFRRNFLSNRFTFLHRLSNHSSIN